MAKTWFGVGDIERKLAKLSTTTFTYRSPSSLFFASEAKFLRREF
jgi:hypothetical protein